MRLNSKGVKTLAKSVTDGKTSIDKRLMEKTENQIIAEFMGEKIHELSVDGTVFIMPESIHFIPRPRKAAYDTSWDWLMPVVEKIRLMDNVIQINMYPNDPSCVIVLPDSKYLSNGRDRIQTNGSPIDMIYKALVEFIKWYNASQEVR